MEFLAILVVPTAIAILLGLRFGKKLAWLTAFSALALAVACLAGWVQIVQYNRAQEGHWGPLGFSDGVGTCSWVAMSFASGMFGAAVASAVGKHHMLIAIALSTLVALVLVWVGVIVMFSVACGYAGQCL